LTASLKVSSLHDTAATFNAPFIKLEDAIIHQHGPEGEHSHEGFATTTWLDFELAAQHANSIFLAMKKRWPEHTDSMQNNHALLQKDLKELHDAMLEIKKQIGNIPLLASHPVYQYATRAYNLNIHSLHWEPDATPDANEWQTFDMFLSNNPTKWMIWEDTPTKETQAKLSQRNIEWIVFRPQGGAIKNDDFLSIMRANIEALKSIKP
ncbi:MAG: zinc ABC transporter solute-binding protein, partial [Verrucomicrobia bacterium]|nr:zinc ABC transporter solute-binding protein [Verrucomicrobiota bacterium]